MVRISPLNESVQQLLKQQDQIFSSAINTKFKFSDEFTYPNGNLSGNGPWLFAFPGGGCATLGCAVTNNEVVLNADTVGGHWTVTRVSTAPLVKRWRIQCRFTGFPDNRNCRQGFGLVTSSAAAFTIDMALGIIVRRVVDAGVVTLNEGEMGPTCIASETVFADPTIAAGDVLAMITAPSGPNNYSVTFLKNNVLLAVRTIAATAGNVGAQPAFMFSSGNATQGMTSWDSFSCREL